MRRRHTSGHKRGGRSRALANETKYPFIVELAVTGEKLEVALGRQIIPGPVPQLELRSRILEPRRLEERRSHSRVPPNQLPMR